MENKAQLTFIEIARRLKQIDLPEVDMVVGIATGGIVPASLAAYKLERPLTLLHINYRAEDNTPQRDAPYLLKPSTVQPPPKRILLVDDVSVTGQTFNLARRLLPDHHVITLAFKGTADYVLFPEIKSCVQWPWRL